MKDLQLLELLTPASAKDPEDNDVSMQEGKNGTKRDRTSSADDEEEGEQEETDEDEAMGISAHTAKVGKHSEGAEETESETKERKRLEEAADQAKEDESATFLHEEEEKSAEM